MTDTDNLIEPGQAAPDGLRAHGDVFVRAVREMCALWARAVKTICLYPASNPLPDEFRAKLFTALSDLLTEEESFLLTTHAGGIDCDNQAVYVGSGDDDLADVFFADGIRELVFLRGITQEESDRFLAICAEAFGAPGRGVDIASRLWEAGFEHIRALTVDRIVNGTYLETVSDRVLEDRHRRFVGAPGTGAPAAVSRDEPTSPYEGIQHERYVHIMRVFGDVAALTEEERAGMGAFGQIDAMSESVGLDILTEIIRSAENRRLLDESVSVLEHQFEQCVQQDRWDRARDVVAWWREESEQAPPAVAQRLAAVSPRLADRRHFDRLTTYLNANPQADLTPIREFLDISGEGVVSSVAAMLGTLKHRPARMMVCSYLAAHAADSVDLVGGFIFDRRWYVARNIAMILGEIGHERGLNFLRRSVSHPDARVRLETLRALQRIGGAEAEQMILGFLTDPESDLRRRALRALGPATGNMSLPELQRQITPERLAAKEPQELRELLTTYARLGGPGEAETLIRLAQKGRLFGRSRRRPVRLAAVWALGASTAPRARGELEIIARGRDQEVARLARSALVRQVETDDGEGSELGDEQQ